MARCSARAPGTGSLAPTAGTISIRKKAVMYHWYAGYSSLIAWSHADHLALSLACRLQDATWDVALLTGPAVKVTISVNLHFCEPAAVVNVVHGGTTFASVTGTFNAVAGLVLIG
jgi:hypothetical protein